VLKNDPKNHQNCQGKIQLAMGSLSQTGEEFSYEELGVFIVENI